MIDLDPGALAAVTGGKSYALKDAIRDERNRCYFRTAMWGWLGVKDCLAGAEGRARDKLARDRRAR